jgi:hypothetical protein
MSSGRKGRKRSSGGGNSGGSSHLPPELPLYRLPLCRLATVEGRVRDGVGEGVSVGVGESVGVGDGVGVDAGVGDGVGVDAAGGVGDVSWLQRSQVGTGWSRAGSAVVGASRRRVDDGVDLGDQVEVVAGRGVAALQQRPERRHRRRIARG